MRRTRSLRWIGLVALAAIGALQCNSANNPTAPPVVAPAISLLSPKGGEDFSLADSIIVKWQVNSDSIGTPNIHTFTLQFSMDSGKNWAKMTLPSASQIADTYTVAWILDTTQFNAVTGSNFVYNDFLNKGILARVQSYPSSLGVIKTARSDFFSFH